MAKKAVTYEYAEGFQKRIAALCLQDPTFLKDYEDVIDPRYFDFEYLTSITRVAMELVSKHNEVPSRATLIESLKEFCSRYKVSAHVVEDYLQRVIELYKIDLVDASSVKERVIRFGQRQALKESVIEIIELIDNDSQFERSLDLIQRALQVGQTTKDLGLRLYGHFCELPGLIARTGRHDKSKKIPTMIADFDHAIHGGPGRKEVWAVLGLPGVGKSQWLVNVGAVALLLGFSVIHVTVGDLDEEDVCVRYAARLTHLPMIDVVNNVQEYQRKAQKLDQYLDRYLRIKYYPSHGLTIPALRAYIAKIITIDGISPDMIIVDYPDEFRPEMDNDYTNMGRIYSGLGGIAAEFDAVMWVASQVQRWSPAGEEDYITQANVADSWRKAHKADGIISLNQTVDEYHRNRARIWLDKVRRGRKHLLIPVLADLTKCYIRQLLDEEIEAEQKRLEEESERKKKEKRAAKARARQKNMEVAQEEKQEQETAVGG